MHRAVDTLGHLLAVHVMPANEQKRAQMGELAQQVQTGTVETVTVAFADQGYIGEAPAKAAQAQGIDLHGVKLPEAEKRLCLAATSMGRRTQLWLVEPGGLNRVG